MTFAAAEAAAGSAAATFYLDGAGQLVHAENGWTLNTEPTYLSHQVYFDADPYADGYAPPACRVDEAHGTLSCGVNRQTQFSICFGGPGSTLGSNGVLYMTGDPVGQGNQCRAVTLNVVYGETAVVREFL